MKIDLQHLRKMSFKRISFIKWKDYHEGWASWELENDLRETYLNFVIGGNDLIGEEKSVIN